MQKSEGCMNKKNKTEESEAFLLAWCCCSWTWNDLYFVKQNGRFQLISFSVLGDCFLPKTAMAVCFLVLMLLFISWFITFFWICKTALQNWDMASNLSSRIWEKTNMIRRLSPQLWVRASARVFVFAEQLCEGYWKGAVLSKEKLSLTFKAEHL